MPVLLIAGACAFEWDGYDPRLSAESGPCEPGAERACYSGPAGTDGVSVCHGGIQRCGDDQTFGACEGEVTPTPEQCLTTDDEDCDGVVLDPEDGCGCNPGELVSCYDGPSGTDGIGACRAGSALCNADGNGYASACIGQVQPFVEECASAIDDDCNGEANDWCASWARRFQGASNQVPWGLAASGAHLVIAGEAAGGVDFGQGVLTANQLSDAFAAKLDMATGDTLWANLYGGPGFQKANAVAIDAAGDVYIAGTFDGSIESGAGLVAATARDAFAMKLDGDDGTPIWFWHGGGTLDQEARAITVTASGQAVVTGWFTGAMNLGSGLVTAVGQDGFVVQLAATGALSWGKAFGGTGIDVGEDVAVDSAGDIYLAGTFAESIDFGGGPVDDVGGVDGFVARLGPTGDHQWLFTMRGDLDTDVHGLALGPDGSVHAVGDFDGSMSLGSRSVASTGDKDAFAVKLTPAGAYAWHALFGDVTEDQGKDVAVGPNGEVLVGIDPHGPITVGGELAITGGAGDLMAVLLDAAGTPQVVRRFGEASDEDLRRVLLPETNAIVVTAECVDALDFGTGNLSGVDGNVDICIARLAP